MKIEQAVRIFCGKDLVRLEKNIEKEILKWKPYVPHVSATLTQRNKEVRLEVSECFLSKSEMFFEEKIVWTDEKYFVLK